MSKSTIKISQSKIDVSSDVHFMPCHFDEDANAAVSTYFKPSVKGHKTLDNVETTTFRGRPLLGTTLSVPLGYEGALLESPADGIDTFTVSETFNSINYWNWDKIPSKDDKVMRAMDWFVVAEAIHNPVNSTIPDKKKNKREASVSPKKSVKK